MSSPSLGRLAVGAKAQSGGRHRLAYVVPCGYPDGVMGQARRQRFYLPEERLFVTLTFEEVRGRPECVAVEVRPEGKRPIRTADLRTIRLQELIAQALDVPRHLTFELKKRRGRTLIRPRMVPDKGRSRERDEPLRLARAAAVYEQGGRKPVERVAQAFQLSHSGAAKLVGRARKAGYLTETTNRVVGGRRTAKARRVLAQSKEGQP